MTALPDGLPLTVRVGYQDYAIVPWTSHYGQDRNRIGEFSANTAEIRITFGMPGRHDQESLLHEILHAVYHHQGLADGDNEERVVGAIAHGLAAAVRDNPAVFMWIATGLINDPGSAVRPHG